MTYLRSEDFEKATESRVDTSKICVGGGSAGKSTRYAVIYCWKCSIGSLCTSGGWLALLTGMGIGFKACGLNAPATPASIAAVYPISDLDDPFWHTKQHPVSYMPRIIKDEEVAEYLDPKQPVSFESTLESKRSMCYPYMIQE